MPYSVHITDDNFNPIQGTVTYTDASGKPLGAQVIPTAGGQLDAGLLSQSSVVTFSEPGYYDFYTGTAQIFEGDFDITLQKKPASAIWEILIGAAAAIAAYKLFKL